MNVSRSLLVAVLFAASASAQSFNIDVGPNLILWPVPSASYAAGAGQPGVWNGVPPSITPQILNNLAGAATTVTVVTDWTSSYTYPFGGLTGDDDAFTADGQALDAVLLTPANWTFSGLVDGDYDVYTYAWDNAGSGTLTDIRIPGNGQPTQSVGGAWTGSPHVLGTTYALHQASVTGGTLVVEAKSSPLGGSGQVIGFQLVQLTSGSILAPFCFGDGSNTMCPCGNPGAAGEGCANSTGNGGKLTGSGTPSVSQDDLVCHGAQLRPSQAALLFVGDNAVAGGNGVVFGDGLRCAGGNIRRLGVRVPNAQGAAVWGPNLGAQGGWNAGDVKRLQIWYRDPVVSPCGTGFNMSNGLEVPFNL